MRRTDFTASLKTARWHGTDMTLANNDATHLFAARTLPASRLGCFRLFRMLSIAYGKKICDAAAETNYFKQMTGQKSCRILSIV